MLHSFYHIQHCKLLAARVECLNILPLECDISAKTTASVFLFFHLEWLVIDLITLAELLYLFVYVFCIHVLDKYLKYIQRCCISSFYQPLWISCFNIVHYCKIQKCMYKKRNVIIIIGTPGLTRYREVVLIVDGL